MIQRKIQRQLESLATMYPIVTITGPRQSGKTTLAKNVFPKYRYVNLENVDIRLFAKEDPKGFLKTYKPPVIFDEIQRVPELLSDIQCLVDEKNESGQYILTGSHQPLLQQGITQSLAGRTGILQLLPLSLEELNDAGISMERDEYLYKGFMPRLYQTRLTAKNLYRDYFATYVEKDLRLLSNVRDLTAFETFIRLLAGRVGQLLNLSSLSNDVGVSVQTISQWISILEASFIIFRLPCYFESFGKRLVKNHKVYFTEVGLASWLLGINSMEQVSRDPLLGNLFENMVVIEALKHRLNNGDIPDLYFMRDSQGFEVDLVCRDSHRNLIPVEIKAAATWSPDFCKNLKAIRKMSGRFTGGTVIYSGALAPEIDGVKFINFRETGSIIP